ncbi:MAG TPA: hypothetical protein VK718_05825 [Ferruginibacter sp.]|jgi:hypothetical protein|nr:hypothetical protein [Ferruginibacter sp.]
MNKLLLILLCILITGTGFSQNLNLLNKSKKSIKKLFFTNSYGRKLNATTEQTDSSVAFILRDSSFHHVDVTAYFDARSKSYKQKIWTDCDSCCKKYIHDIVSKWKQLNDTLYMSKDFILTDTRQNDPFSFIIIRNPFNKEAYKAIIAGKNNRYLYLLQFFLKE